MAGEGKGTLLLRPGFLLFCLYVMAYFTTRGYGEIIYSPMAVRGGGASTAEHVVGVNYDIPRWRRQMYRAVFSPLMVAEEEFRRLAAGGKGMIQDGRDMLPF